MQPLHVVSMFGRSLRQWRPARRGTAREGGKWLGRRSWKTLGLRRQNPDVATRDAGAQGGSMPPKRSPLVSLCAVAVFLLLLAVAPAAQAFDTQPHNDITLQATAEEGFSQPAAQVVAVENFFPDLYTNDKENPFSGHHAWYHPLTIIGGGAVPHEELGPLLTSPPGPAGLDPPHAHPPRATAGNQAGGG